ncbi:MAG TPA: ABC transporter substrate-binding protein [Beutenbergiaceae bacterium]|nr:ABC transporter substrate-binding protein [Beutenbergiaceae bacterium]
MKRSTKKALVPLAAVALLVAACNGGNGDGGNGNGNGEGGNGEGAEPLQYGYVLPETGPLAFLGPPQVAALEYAIQEINEAGGILGTEVPAPMAGDEAGDQAIASQSTDRLLADGVDAIIGAAASGMSLAIIDRITSEQVVQCSGANTAPTFTDYDDGGFYIRTAPSDALQGPVLAETVINDGHEEVVIVHLEDDYGLGLARATEAGIEELGGNVISNEGFDGNATEFTGVVQSIVSADPDAVVIIAFEQGVQIVQGLIEAGLNPQETGFYGADGMRSQELANLVDPDNPGVLEGMKGTAPASAENPDFLTELNEFAELDETQFAPQVYDCAMIIALAAEAAGSTDPVDFQPELIEVTREGTDCSSFAECRDLLADGEDINFNGASGPLNFTDAGEPEIASIEVYGYDAEGALSTLEVVESAPLE